MSSSSAFASRRETAAIQAFTRDFTRPKATFALVLASIAVAAVSMAMDAVPRYSQTAFFVGIALAGAFATLVGTVVNRLEGSPRKLLVTLLLPTACGAVIGVVVQVMVLAEVGTLWSAAVKDLGGLVDTTRTASWVAGGIVLGGAPALLVTGFLLLASRALRRLGAHDASEGFGVVFTGGAGLFAAFALVLVDGVAATPLVLVAIASAVTVLVAILIDGARIRFLHSVYAGLADGFDVVPAAQFANDPTLAPVATVARGMSSVLVRIERAVGSYRSAAAEPIALVADTELETLRPIRRRRITAAAMLVVMATLFGASVLTHL